MKISSDLNLIFSKLREPKAFYFGLASAVLAAVISAFIPYIQGRAVDAAISLMQIETALVLVALWLVLAFFVDRLNYVSGRQAYSIGIDLSNDFLTDIFHHLVMLPLSFHKKKKMGKVMRRVDRGSEDLFTLVESTIFNFLPSLISFAIALVVVLAVEWRLALILFFGVILYSLLTALYTQKIVKMQRRVYRGWEKSYGDLWDSVTNVQSVKSAVAEEYERKRNIRNFNVAGKTYKDWRLVGQKMRVWQRLVSTLSFIAVFGVGIVMLRSGFITTGKFIMFIGYMNLLIVPLSQIADQYRIIKTGLFSFKRALKYYRIAEEKDVAGAVEIEDLKGKIEFIDVEFGYKKNQPILSGISFSAQAGETVALVGESGVGKSTLTDLVGRYILPTKGRVLIDGLNVKRIKLESLRGQMAIVPQDILLFNDTIFNNIRYGNPKAGEETVIKAAQAANAHEFIEKLPRKYRQLVGERGIKLSAGQKQRIAIARAILRNPRILILDEATSALDSLSEKLVQEALKTLIQGRTTFVIAHRLSTIQHADKIIVLKKGRIAEMGVHEELMKNPEGIYRNFWELQSAMKR